RRVGDRDLVGVLGIRVTAGAQLGQLRREELCLLGGVRAVAGEAAVAAGERRVLRRHPLPLVLVAGGAQGIAGAEQELRLVGGVRVVAARAVAGLEGTVGVSAALGQVRLVVAGRAQLPPAGVHREGLRPA